MLVEVTLSIQISTLYQKKQKVKDLRASWTPTLKPSPGWSRRLLSSNEVLHPSTDWSSHTLFFLNWMQHGGGGGGFAGIQTIITSDWHQVPTPKATTPKTFCMHNFMPFNAGDMGRTTLVRASFFARAFNFAETMRHNGAEETWLNGSKRWHRFNVNVEAEKPTWLHRSRLPTRPPAHDYISVPTSLRFVAIIRFNSSSPQLQPILVCRNIEAGRYCSISDHHLQNVHVGARRGAPTVGEGGGRPTHGREGNTDSTRGGCVGETGGGHASPWGGRGTEWSTPISMSTDWSRPIRRQIQCSVWKSALKMS